MAADNVESLMPSFSDDRELLRLLASESRLIGRLLDPFALPFGVRFFDFSFAFGATFYTSDSVAAASVVAVEASLRG